MVLFRQVDVHGEVVVKAGSDPIEQTAQLSRFGLQTFDGGDVIRLLSRGKRSPIWGAADVSTEEDDHLSLRKK